MAEAKKCDRCGNLYDYIRQDVLVECPSKSPDDYFDLCDDCMLKLMRFLKGAEFEND